MTMIRRLALVALVLAPLPALAQARCDRVQEIRFPAGASATELRGGTPRGSIDCYAFGARAGQRLELGISSVENNAVFQVYAPGWRDTPANGPVGAALPGTAPGTDAMRFGGTLPANGRYLVVVGNTRGGSDYRLRVAIR